MFSLMNRKLVDSCHIWGKTVSRNYGFARDTRKVVSIGGENIDDSRRNDYKSSLETVQEIDRNQKQKARKSRNPELEKSILGDMEYTWLKDTDKRLKVLHSVSSIRSVRERKRLVVLEGKRLVGDALDAKANVKGLFFSRVELLDGMDLTGLEGKLLKVKHSQLEYVTGVTTPPGIMALVETPTIGKILSTVDRTQLRPITLIVDNIRDPGNMGTLLRSAAAVGCHKIFATSGNVDIWEPKVLRAGAGCHFRTDIQNNLSWFAIHELLSDNCTILLADNNVCNDRSDTRRVNDTDSDRPEHTEPGSGGSIIAVRAGPRRTVEVEPVDAFSVDIGSAEEVAVIVGGETHGLSADAYQLLNKQSGRAVKLPMVPGVDSLNAAMAGTVLLYEIRRQMDLHSRS